jgi:hypothetical protein
VQGSFEIVEKASAEGGIVRVEHVDDIKGDVLCVGVLWGTKGDGEGYDSDWFNSFAAEVIEGLRLFSELLSIVTHFFKALRKRISAWMPLSTRILVTSHLSTLTVSTIVSVCGNEARLTSWAVKVMGT